jgi:hypothetical protein
MSDRRWEVRLWRLLAYETFAGKREVLWRSGRGTAGAPYRFRRLWPVSGDGEGA